jgi:hypothetical protein
MFQVQPLSQMDPQWKNKLLGNDTTSTIGSYGCLLTSLAMVINGLGASETPATLNDKMKNAGGFQGALLIPGILSSAVPGYNSDRFEKYPNAPASLADIDASLAAGDPIIVEVDYSPAAGLQTHWILLLGKSGNDYLIQDPWPYPCDTQPVLLTKRFGFAGAPQNIIKAALWIVRIAPRPKPVPQPVPTSGLVLYASTDKLALRTQPVIADSTLITRLSTQTRLYVTEDAAAAQAKIGVQGQWLQVIEAEQGYPGFVAAWCVSTSPSQPTPAADLFVYTSGEGVALRSQPTIQSSTVIKRESVNTRLQVLEDSTQALKKIGVDAQWLQVKDSDNTQGYVAAWYVSQTTQPALGVLALSIHPHSSVHHPSHDSGGVG